jgi:DNA repair exonuclease SbcCD ATPase subunit
MTMRETPRTAQVLRALVTQDLATQKRRVLELIESLEQRFADIKRKIEDDQRASQRLNSLANDLAEALGAYNSAQNAVRALQTELDDEMLASLARCGFADCPERKGAQVAIHAGAVTCELCRARLAKAR